MCFEKFQSNSEKSFISHRLFKRNTWKINVIEEVIDIVFNETMGLFESYKQVKSEINLLNVGEVALNIQIFDEF